MRHITLASLLFVAGCSQTISMEKDILSQGRAFATMDLQNAKAKATMAGDVIGAALWTCLMPVTMTPNPNGVGIATGLEDARIVQSCLPVSPGIVP